MNPEPEMDEWRQVWSGADVERCETSAADVIAAARRSERRALWTLIANIGFAILLLAVSLLVLQQTRSREMALWALCVWITTGIACWLAIEAWRRSRVNDIVEVADYAAFHRKRAATDQWKVRSAVIFLALQAGIASVWLTTDLFLARISWARFAIAMAILFVICGLWLVILRRIWRRSQAILKTTISDVQDT
jgi:hypothetical protein